MRQLLLITIAAFLATGAAALGLALDPTTMPHSQAAPVDFTPAALDAAFPNYPGSSEISIGRGLEINGQRVDMHQYFTDDSADNVASYYRAVFAEAAGPQLLDFELKNARYVGYPVDSNRFFQVMILSQPDGSSLVIPNISRGRINPGAEARALSVPLPGDHQALVSSRSETRGKRTTSAQFVTSGGLEEVALFYRSRLPPLGFQQLPGSLLPESISKTGILRFKHPTGTLLTVSVQDLGEAQGSFVYLVEETQDASTEGLSP